MAIVISIETSMQASRCDSLSIFRKLSFRDVLIVLITTKIFMENIAISQVLSKQFYLNYTRKAARHHASYKINVCRVIFT